MLGASSFAELIYDFFHGSFIYKVSESGILSTINFKLHIFFQLQYFVILRIVSRRRYTAPTTVVLHFKKVQL